MVFIELNEINEIRCHLWTVLTFVSDHLIKINIQELFLDNTK